jgi:putative FmdB family regulatory protein
MPTYTYKCDTCQRTGTYIHRMNDKPTILCQDCKTPMRKTYDIGAVTFKGNGWGKQER